MGRGGNLARGDKRALDLIMPEVEQVAHSATRQPNVVQQNPSVSGARLSCAGGVDCNHAARFRGIESPEIAGPTSRKGAVGRAVPINNHQQDDHPKELVLRGLLIRTFERPRRSLAR